MLFFKSRKTMKTTTSGKMLRILAVTLLLISPNTGIRVYASLYLKESPFNFPENRSDSLGNKLKKVTSLQFGAGNGICAWGGTLGLNFTSIRPRNLGVSVHINGSMVRSRDIPVDYFEDGERVFAPKDYVNIISVNLVKEFLTRKKSIRFGMETGPSWVNCNKAEFRLNPNYNPNQDPNTNFFYTIGTHYKYYKSHSRINTIGFTLMGKMDFVLKRHTGLELSAFTNINTIRSVVGINIYFIFGRLDPRI
jgi:hypothetical protein